MIINDEVILKRVKLLLHSYSFYIFILCIISIGLSKAILIYFNLFLGTEVEIKTVIFYSVLFLFTSIKNEQYKLEDCVINVNKIYAVFSVIYITFVMCSFSVLFVYFEDFNVQNKIVYWSFYIFFDSVVQGILTFIIIDACIVIDSNNIKNKKLETCLCYSCIQDLRIVAEFDNITVLQNTCRLPFVEDVIVNIDYLNISIDSEWRPIAGQLEFLYEMDNNEDGDINPKVLRLKLLEYNISPYKNNQKVKCLHNNLIYPFNDCEFEYELQIPTAYVNEVITNIDEIIKIEGYFYFINET